MREEIAAIFNNTPILGRALSMRFSLLLVQLILFFTIFDANAFTIAIDAGHGGTDQGATRGPARESKIVLGVAQKLVQLIHREKSDDAFLTRDSDTAMELSHRVKIAQKKSADLFVSIHANSSPDPQSHGMEVYFRNELTPDQHSLALAHQENQSEKKIERQKRTHGDIATIVNDLKSSMGTLKSYELSWHVLKEWKVPFSKLRSQPVQQGPFTVVQQHIPALLIEIGFITNEKEAQRLMNDNYQKQIAQNIYNGIKDYKETLDKGQSKALK